MLNSNGHENRSSPGSAGNRHRRLIPLVLVLALTLLSIPFSPIKGSSTGVDGTPLAPGFMEVQAAASTAPALTLPSLTSGNNYVNANGSVTYVPANVNVSGVGFVYGYNNPPSNYSSSISESASFTARTGASSVTVPFSKTLYPNFTGTVYVQSYVQYGGSTKKYSSTQQVNINGGGGYNTNVYVSNVYNVSGNSVDIQFYTPYSNPYSCGVIYSYNSIPSYGNGHIVYASNNGSSYHQVRLNNLYSDARYYVRPFYTDGNGQFILGEAKTFYTNSNGYYNNGYYNNGYYNYYGSSSTYRAPTDGTSNNSMISTQNITDVTDTTAVATGEVGYSDSYSNSSNYYNNNDYYYYNGQYYRYDNTYYNNGYYNDNYYYNDGKYYNRNYYNYERGFVYSTTVIAPTLSDSKVYEANASGGSYTCKLTDLKPETKYYVRSYVRNSYGTFYGAALNFTTKPAGNTGTQASGSPYVGAGSASTSTGTSSVQKPYMEQVAPRIFGPDTPTTRGEVAKMIYAITNGTPVADSSGLSDITSGHQLQTEINYVVSKGYMQGYPDGTFKPGNNITRAEISTVLCVVFNLTPNASPSRFSDVTYHWAKDYITAASNAGIISGYPNNIFKPDANTTRAEACVLFARAAGRVLEPIGQSQFIDVPASHWAYRYVMNAALAY